LSSAEDGLPAAIGRAAERYVRTHRQGSMATVTAMILFDALRQDVERARRATVTAFSRPQMRELMAAHPAWEGKAFEETSFNTVPEDLGDQLEQFEHDDVIGGHAAKIRFRGPTRKYRNDKSSRELYLEYEVTPPLGESTVKRKTAWRAVIVASLLALGVLGSLLFAILRNRAETSDRPVTIAVLPFHVISGQRDLEFLRVAMADAVIAQLSSNRQLRVRPTAAILRYTASDAKKAASELEADYVLTGTLQDAASRLSASVQLVRASDFSPVWAERFEIQRGDLLGLQDSVAQEVARSLRLPPHQQLEGNTETSAAFDLYLQGRSSLLNGTPENVRRAVDLFELAIKADPRYARAFAGLASAAANMQYLSAGTPDAELWRRRGHAAAKEAVRLGPDLAETHEALAEVHSAAEFEWEEVIAEDRRALAINPGSVIALTGAAAAYAHLGLASLARKSMITADQVDPVSKQDHALSRAACEFFAGDFAAAYRAYERAAERPIQRRRAWTAPMIMFFHGDESGALAILAESKTGFRAARARAIEAAIHAYRGRRDEAQSRLDSVLQGGYFDHHVSYYLGVAEANLRNNGEATTHLSHAIETGFPCYPHFAADHMLAGYRATPEGAELMRKLQDRWQATKRKYGE
jgi:TolB-like protein